MARLDRRFVSDNHIVFYQPATGKMRKIWMNPIVTSEERFDATARALTPCQPVFEMIAAAASTGKKLFNGCGLSPVWTKRVLRLSAMSLLGQCRRLRRDRVSIPMRCIIGLPLGEGLALQREFLSEARI